MRYQYLVSFSDVDYARVLFFGRYYFIAQRASEAWLHQHGLYYRDLLPQYDLRIPIVASFCRYLGPIYVEDSLDVDVGVKDVSPRGFTFVFAFYRQGEDRCLAWGYTERRFVSAEGKPKDATEPILSIWQQMAEESRGFVDEVWAPLAERRK